MRGREGERKKGEKKRSTAKGLDLGCAIDLYFPFTFLFDPMRCGKEEKRKEKKKKGRVGARQTMLLRFLSHVLSEEGKKEKAGLVPRREKKKNTASKGRRRKEKGEANRVRILFQSFSHLWVERGGKKKERARPADLSMKCTLDPPWSPKGEGKKKKKKRKKQLDREWRRHAL